MTDAILIGGGHNGLVCAYYLARAGLAVTVCERRHIPGGAAITEEFLPGYRNSVASYTVSLLHPDIIRDMSLARHGLIIRERPIANFLPTEDGRFLKLGGGMARSQAEVAKFSAKDAARLPEYYAMLDRVGEVLRRFTTEIPPSSGDGLAGLARALMSAEVLRRESLETQRDVLDLFTKSARAVLDAWFESDPIKAVLGFDSVVGNYASPDTPGSAYVLLHHTFGGVNGKRGEWGHAVGGMGAITEAMARACREAGVDLRMNAAVARVVTRHGRAVGVRLADGTQLSAKRIIANVNPKLLFTRLVAPEDLTPEFRRRIGAYACGSGTFRMNVGLRELPDFTCLPGRNLAEHHQSGIILAPSLAYMDRAYGDARAHGWSRRPIVEMLIPSTVDETLAPAGHHVASLFCQHVAPVLPDRDWATAKDEVADLMIDTVTRFAPNFRAAVIGRMALSPADLEATFGLIGGDIMHGAMSLDQLWASRPVLGHGAYAGPLPGLYMCGAGTHPGGGVSGLPGRNAARRILADRNPILRWLARA